MKKQTIELAVAGIDVVFKVDIIKYNAFLNSGAGKNKVQAVNNFLISCCEENQKEFLREQFGNEPGTPTALLEVILEEYAPDVSVIVKKSKTEPSNSGETA